MGGGLLPIQRRWKRESRWGNATLSEAPLTDNFRRCSSSPLSEGNCRGLKEPVARGELLSSSIRRPPLASSRLSACVRPSARPAYRPRSLRPSPPSHRHHPCSSIASLRPKAPRRHVLVMRADRPGSLVTKATMLQMAASSCPAPKPASESDCSGARWQFTHIAAYSPAPFRVGCSP